MIFLSALKKAARTRAKEAEITFCGSAAEPFSDTSSEMSVFSGFRPNFSIVPLCLHFEIGLNQRRSGFLHQKAKAFKEMECMWFDESVIYQIYPLGAAGAPFYNPAYTEEGARADDGIDPETGKARILRFKEWAEPLKERNIKAVLFNPLFESISHGYDTVDYRNVDRRLGSNEDLIEVVDELHDKGINVIYDAVFNHVGRDFFAFQDVLKNQSLSTSTATTPSTMGYPI